MSYQNNRSYNTRRSGGRGNFSNLNNLSNFVSAGEMGSEPAAAAPHYQTINIPPPSSFTQLYSNAQPQPQPQTQPQLQQPPPPPPQPELQTADTEMNQEPAEGAGAGAGGAAGEGGDAAAPHWMKSKLTGVKKITNKERRRRQNLALRRRITPKNALMALAEITALDSRLGTGPQEVKEKVEPALGVYFGSSKFCAELAVGARQYKGYGENKVAARNAAAEQALRDIVIERMATTNTATTADDASSVGGEEGAEEPVLPMMQLASYALHRLFSEWQLEGHAVPLLRPPPPPDADQQMADASTNGNGTGAAPAAAAGAAGAVPAAPATGPKKKKKKNLADRPLPPQANDMHPCVVLTHMRAALAVYRTVGAEPAPAPAPAPGAAPAPHGTLFTVAVDVDGHTFTGKASNKKEARRLAARAACQQLFGLSFVPGAPVPALGGLGALGAGAQ